MSAKHTELPWTSIDDHVWSDHGHDDVLVARSDIQGRSLGERKANAAYIVKACNGYPKLLEACAELIPYVGWYIKQCNTQDSSGSTVAGELARQAIEKAEALIAQA